jgi:phosphoadenosine phosphosulfate reductase
MTKEYLVNKLSDISLADGLARVAALFPGKVAFSSSMGQEDQLIADVIFRKKIPIRIFTLDTGRLFNETYELIERTHARYKQRIEVFFPEASDVEEYIKNKGVNGFYESVENRKTCCNIRKVKPLARALKNTQVWITGLRSEQSAHRKEMELIEVDEQFRLYKYNPLIHWSYQQVVDYLHEWNVPYNPLHDKGFISIGCQPCTRAISEWRRP